jgi:hypothetical protein
MNYIKKLETTLRSRDFELETLRAGLLDLKVYLTSAKFSSPGELQNYVNVKDVLLRLAEAESSAADAANSYIEIYPAIK